MNKHGLVTLALPLVLGVCICAGVTRAGHAEAPNPRDLYRHYVMLRGEAELELEKFCVSKKNYAQAKTHLDAAAKDLAADPRIDKELAKLKDKESSDFDDKGRAAYDKKIADRDKSLARELGDVAALYVQVGRKFAGYRFAKQATALDADNKSAAKLVESLQADADKAAAAMQKNVENASKTVASFDASLCGLPFFIRMPETVEPGRLYPVLLHVHGAGDKGDNAVNYFPPEREAGYIICAPSFGYSGESPASTIEQDEKSLLRIVEYISDYLPVDPEGIILTSHSAGGHMLYPVIGKHTDVFRAFIAFNSVYPDCGYAKQKIPNPKPILVIEGTKDFNRGIGQRAVTALRNGNYSDVTFLELEGVDHNGIDKS